ncbi:hypothetical protein D1007_10870 [Hordeum vulgare]|nr:hypothetical protein D1007_10870 [Hordeum vulgare]
MPFTRKRRIARLLVTVLDVEYIPDFTPWSYDGVHYDLDVEVEETQPHAHDGDVHMADGDDRDGDHGDANLDEHSEKVKDDINPSSSTASDKPLNDGVAPTTTPMNTLRFGSFEVIPTLSRLWGDYDVQERHVEPVNGSSYSTAMVYEDASVQVDQLGGREDSRLGLHVTPASREALVKPLGSSQARVLVTPASNGSNGRQEMLRSDGVEVPGIGQEARISSPCITTDFCRHTERQPLHTQDRVHVL